MPELGPIGLVILALIGLVALATYLEKRMTKSTDPTFHDGVVLDYENARSRRRARGHEPVFRETVGPNVEAYSYYLDHGTKVTLYRSTPGDTAPRMQMRLQDDSLVNAGFVEKPERYGSHDDFRAWCIRFAEDALTHQES